MNWKEILKNVLMMTAGIAVVSIFYQRRMDSASISSILIDTSNNGSVQKKWAYRCTIRWGDVYG